MNKRTQNRRTLVTVLFVALIGAGFVWAQNKVDQGAPGKQGPWPVTFSTPTFPADGGNPSGIGSTGIFPYPCGATTLQSVTLLDGGSQPVGSLASRVYIIVCNGAANDGGLMNCRADGTQPTGIAANNVGQKVSIGNCVPYSNPGGRPVYCIGSNVFVDTYECGP